MDPFSKYGGYRKLDSFTIASIVQLATWRFCTTFLDRRNDPCGRQFDQMTQAARSGRVNIAEGSERASTSTETEMRLTDVARASLAELKNVYEFWLLSRRKLPWKVPSPEACAVLDLRLDPNPLGEGDGLHEASAYLLAQYDRFAHWLDSDAPDLAANALRLLIGRALNMLGRQKEAQGKASLRRAASASACPPRGSKRETSSRLRPVRRFARSAASPCVSARPWPATTPVSPSGFAPVITPARACGRSTPSDGSRDSSSHPDGIVGVSRVNRCQSKNTPFDPTLEKIR